MEDKVQKKIFPKSRRNRQDEKDKHIKGLIKKKKSLTSECPRKRTEKIAGRELSKK